MDCSVCMENTNENSKTTCGHYICESCTCKMCSMKCPICRFEPFSNFYTTKEVVESIKKREQEYLDEINFNNTDQDEVAVTVDITEIFQSLNLDLTPENADKNYTKFFIAVAIKMLGQNPTWHDLLQDFDAGSLLLRLTKSFFDKEMAKINNPQRVNV